jgi:hypothetical protein
MRVEVDMGLPVDKNKRGRMTCLGLGTYQTEQLASHCDIRTHICHTGAFAEVLEMCKGTDPIAGSGQSAPKRQGHTSMCKPVLRDD